MTDTKKAALAILAAAEPTGSTRCGQAFHAELSARGIGFERSNGRGRPSLSLRSRAFEVLTRARVIRFVSVDRFEVVS